MIKIAFVSDDFGKNKIKEFKNTSLFSIISAFYPVEYVHIRTLLSLKNSPAFDVIIITFTKKHLSIIRKLGNIANLKSKIVIYINRKEKDVYDFIMENRRILDALTPVSIILTTQYCFAYKVKEIIKREIFELLDYQSKFWKIKLLLQALYKLQNDPIFLKEISQLSKHRIFNYMDNIVHIYGKEKIEFEEDEFIVVCIVKNGEIYIRQFIEYYTKLGARHIYFIDNASGDRTISICREYPYVSVYLTTLFFPDYECEIRNAFIKYVCNNRWCLYVDIDEYFDYPYSDKTSMRVFLQYLNIYNYTAVYLFMFNLYAKQNFLKEDLFREKVPEELKSYPFLRECIYYDLKHIIKKDYKKIANTNNLCISNKAIQLHFKKNNVNEIKAFYKHSLLYVNDTIELFHSPHVCQNANIADVTCILKHIKLFTSSYDNIYSDESMRYKNIYPLIENNEVLVTQQYCEFINQITQKTD